MTHIAIHDALNAIDPRFASLGSCPDRRARRRRHLATWPGPDRPIPVVAHRLLKGTPMNVIRRTAALVAVALVFAFIPTSVADATGGKHPHRHRPRSRGRQHHRPRRRFVRHPAAHRHYRTDRPEDRPGDHLRRRPAMPSMPWPRGCGPLTVMPAHRPLRAPANCSAWTTAASMLSPGA